MEISVQHINEAESFRFSYGRDLEPLVLSIVDSGIIDPLIVKKSGSKYFIICGSRRLAVARKLGMSTVPVREWHGTDIEALQLALLENRSVRTFNLIEKAQIIRALRTMHISDPAIMNDYFPFLELAPKADTIVELLKILELEGYWMVHIAQGKLMLETALLLVQWSVVDRTALQAFLGMYQINMNKTREFIVFLDDIMLRDRTTVSAILDGLVTRVPRAEQHDQQFELFRKALRALRYPRLTSVEKKWMSAVQELHVGEGITIDPPRDFEGDTVTVHIQARNAAQLQDRLQHLNDASVAAHFPKLFEQL